MLVSDSPFQPSIIFAGKAGAYPRGALLRIALFVHAPHIACKYWTRVEVTDSNKYYAELMTLYNGTGHLPVIQKYVYRGQL